MDKTRRNLLLGFGSTLALMPISQSLRAIDILGAPADLKGNFHYIYSDAAYESEFLEFLTNVFNLYPEKELHNLIASTTEKETIDERVYSSLQQMLPSITPALADFRYALPALSKQKEVIVEQTLNLFDGKKSFDGYLEIGSTGRYLDKLEHRVEINGKRYFIHEKLSSYSPVDMIDRGQIGKSGEELLLNNYQPDFNKHIPSKSLDLVTVYIGFHHCPLSLRESFIGNIREILSDNGKLIVRDHNVTDSKMYHMVALAHDVFNMGTKESWQYNQSELRHFYSLNTFKAMMRKYGFKTDGRELYQPGDPTHNALMVFTKA